MATWAGIVRVSHMGKRKAGSESFHSERDQVKAIKDAAPKGERVKILPPELDVSGGLPLEQRPSLKEAVEGVERGRFAGIIVAYQSRLGRDTEYEEGVWRRVEKAGGKIILALDAIDTTTIDGRTFRRIRSAMNQAERERHVESFDRLNQWCVENSVWKFRQVPRGYRKGPDRKLAPDRRAEGVRRAFKDRAAGVAVSEIARRLGMTTSGVRQMLANRVYLGELRVGPYVNASAHEPLVDVDLWHAAQRTQPRPPRSGKAALMAGVVRCAGCGHVMSRTGPEAKRAYLCSRQHSGGACPAPAGVSAHLVEAIGDNYGRWVWDGLTATATQGDTAEQARRDLQEAERELDTYLEAVSAADVGAEAFAEGARGRRARVVDARERLDLELGKRLAVPDGVEWDDVPVHLRNQFLRDSLACIVVKRAGGRGSRTPLAARVRILERGYDLTPLEPIALPRLDVPHVLGVERFQNPPL